MISHIFHAVFGILVLGGGIASTILFIGFNIAVLEKFGLYPCTKCAGEFACTCLWSRRKQMKIEDTYRKSLLPLEKLLVLKGWKKKR